MLIYTRKDSETNILESYFFPLLQFSILNTFEINTSENIHENVDITGFV